MPNLPSWPCDAYGDDGLAVGAWCFLTAAPERRLCTTTAMCQAYMDVERIRVWTGILELADAGDQVGIELRARFSGPEELLKGNRLPRRIDEKDKR